MLEVAIPATPTVDPGLLFAILQTRGNARLRLAAALVCESNLSFEEVCHLTPMSFNLMSHEIGIRSEVGVVLDVCDPGLNTLYGFFAWMSVRSVRSRTATSVSCFMTNTANR